MLSNKVNDSITVVLGSLLLVKFIYESKSNFIKNETHISIYFLKMI